MRAIGRVLNAALLYTSVDVFASMIGLSVELVKPVTLSVGEIAGHCCGSNFVGCIICGQ